MVNGKWLLDWWILDKRDIPCLLEILPHIRMGPQHGTCFKIAGKSEANSASAAGK